MIDSETGRRENISVIPDVSIREAVANALTHQELGPSGQRIMIEIFDNRIEVSNSGRPLIPPARFLDQAPNARNPQLARDINLLRFNDNCGRGWEKVVQAVEEQKAPAPEILVRDYSTTVVLWAEKPFALLTRQERDWTVYLHSVLQYLSGNKATNTSLRGRFGLKDAQTALGSKLFKQAIESGWVRAGEEKVSNKNKYYVPYWAAPGENGAEG